MKGLQLKYMEIIFDKEKPQSVGTDIKIIAKAENNTNLDYKFIVGKGGVWTAIQEFSKKNECIWTPKDNGDYISMDYMIGTKESFSTEDNIERITKCFLELKLHRTEVEDGE